MQFARVSSAMRPTWAMEQIAPVGRSPWRTTNAAIQVWFAVRVLASASPHWRENVTASGSGPTAPSALMDGTMAFHAERCLACICLFVDKFRLFFLLHSTNWFMEFTLPRVVYEWISFVTPTAGTARYYAATDGQKHCCVQGLPMLSEYDHAYQYAPVGGDKTTCCSGEVSYSSWAVDLKGKHDGYYCKGG